MTEKLCYETQEGLWAFSKVPTSQSITTHPHSFKIITRFPFYSTYSSSLPRLIFLFLFKKLVRINISPNWIGSYLPKGKRETPPKHPSSPFKEKEKEGEGRSKAWWPMEGGREGSWLGGQWKEKEKVLSLVANGRKMRRFLAWWPMEGKGKGSQLGGQWKEEEKVHFYLFHFSPKQLYLNLHFLSFTLRFYFALVLGHYLRPPFIFLGL